MVEIELSVLGSQCLARRIPTIDALTVQVDAWCEQRNRTASAIDWTFTIDKARAKLGRSYP